MRKVLFIFSVLTDGDVEWLGHAGERVHVDPGMELIALGARPSTSISCSTGGWRS